MVPPVVSPLEPAEASRPDRGAPGGLRRRLEPASRVAPVSRPRDEREVPAHVA